MRLKLTIAYDGTAFRGWARQPGERTVEQVLKDALTTVYGSFNELAVAGRTDTGVHALANVISFDAGGGPPVEKAPAALNTVLPEDIAVLRADAVADDFSARWAARSRTYRYRIWRRRERSPFEVNRSLWHAHRLEPQKLSASAAMVVGEHDFRAFTPSETEHKTFVRTVEDARWFEHGDALEFEVTANAFLRHMVRTLVGTMLERDPDDFIDLLAGAHRDQAGSTAAPHGLYLVSVGY